MNYKLEIQDLSKIYNNQVVALQDMHAKVLPGTLVGLVGANGAGKSTLIHIIAGILRPTTGRVKLQIEDFSSLAWVSQTTSLDWYLKVLDNVRLGARMAGFSLSASYQLAHEAMELANITDLQDKDVETISGGQQRRVQIARAIAQQADILLLDEPTIGLDYAACTRFMEYLCTLTKQGKVVIISSHDLTLLERYIDWIWFLKHGVLEVNQSLAQFLTSSSKQQSVKKLVVHYQGKLEESVLSNLQHRGIQMKQIIRTDRGISWKQLLSLNQYSTIVEYEFLSLIQTKARAICNIILKPILQPILFGAGISGFAPRSNAIFGTTHYLAFIFPGIVGLGLFGTFSQIIYRLTMDRRYGLQGLKISSGVGILAYILGNLSLPVMISLLRAFITAGVLILLTTPMEGATNLVLMLGVCIISTCFWGILGMLISFAFKSYAQRDLFLEIAMIPLTLASPAFYPLESAPPYLRIISFFNPLTYNIIALREAFLYGKVSYAWILVLITTLLLFIGVTLCTRSLHK